MPYKDKDKQLAAQKRAYDQDSDSYKNRQRERRRRAAKHIWDIKEASKCKNCGENHPATFDFHHRDQDEKEITASRMIANKYSIERINAELEKCDILCANCHRILHYNENNGV